MKKILLQINSVANWGSTGRIAEEIGKTAMENGWESYIAYGRGNPNNSKSHLIKIGNELYVKIHGLQSRLLDNHGLASKWATEKFIKQIEKLNPDVIHLHNIHGYYLNYSLLFEYLKKIDIPIVWTLHDCWPITGHCAYFSFKECEKWKTGCHNCPQRKEYPSSVFIDRSQRNFELKKRAFNGVKNMTLVPVSDWLGGMIKESFLSSINIHRIHNGIDIEVFKPSQINSIKDTLCINDKKIILGVASVWEERKGLSDFIKLRSVLSEDYCIILIGLNELQIKSLPDGIVGITRTNNVSELVAFYSQADVFVNPTWEDNFPTTNLEALACGTPVITYRTGGSIEAVDDNTGVIVEQGDINGLKQAIESVLIGKINSNKYSSESCRKRAEKFYNKNDRYKEYIVLYNKVNSKKL